MTIEVQIKSLRFMMLITLLLCVGLLGLVSYQNQTIATQQSLIRVLFEDSMQLQHMKMEKTFPKNESKKVPQEMPPDATPGCLPHQTCG
jgi:Tfp pilus assembly protein PilV